MFDDHEYEVKIDMVISEELLDILKLSEALNNSCATRGYKSSAVRLKHRELLLEAFELSIKTYKKNKKLLNREYDRRLRQPELHIVKEEK